MDRQEAVQALDMLRRVVRQARDETALNNWGLIWMIHSVTNGGAFVCTDELVRRGYGPMPIFSMWGGIVAINVAIVLVLRRRSGARSFVETQMWGIWLAFLAAMPLLGVLNAVPSLPAMTYAPMVAVLAAFAFTMMGLLMSRAFFAASAIFVATAIAMAMYPGWAFTILGVVWAAAQFTWGFVLHRSRGKGGELV